MAGYITLCKFTQKGLADIKNIEEMLKKGKAASEKMGIRFVGYWLTLGEYDAIMIVDAPDDQTMAAYLLAGGMTGTVTTKTMRAFSEKEIAQVVGKLPQ